MGDVSDTIVRMCNLQGLRLFSYETLAFWFMDCDCSHPRAC